MTAIHRRGRDAWTPPRPTIAQQVAKRGPIMPMPQPPRGALGRFLGRFL